MLDIFVKYFFITFYSFLIFMKLLNLFRKIDLLKYILISFFISIITTTVRSYPQLTKTSILLIFLQFFIAVTLLTHTTVKSSFVTSLIAVGMSNAIYALCVIIVSFACYLIGLDEDTNIVYLLILAVLLEFVILYFIFKIRRFKKGMPFLHNISLYNAGVFICFIILLCISILINNENNNYFYLIAIILVIFLYFFLIIWWRKYLTKLYLDRKKQDEIQDLKEVIQNQEKEIEKLKHQNEEFASLIHRDNKIIPALELSVRNYIQLIMNNNSGSLFEDGILILDNLNKISQERYGILNDTKKSDKQLPRSNIFSLDSLMDYFLDKTSSLNIDLELSILGNMNFFIQQTIQEKDLNTLIADMVDNAINAVSNSTQKRIFLNIGIRDDCYAIDILDSGHIFDIDILLNLGLIKRTTQKETDCHGIGLMTLYELSQKYQASIIIDEYSEDIYLYTKKISIRFDYENQYIIKTYRSNEFQSNLRPHLTVMSNHD